MKYFFNNIIIFTICNISLTYGNTVFRELTYQDSMLENVITYVYNNGLLKKTLYTTDSANNSIINRIEYLYDSANNLKVITKNSYSIFDTVYPNNSCVYKMSNNDTIQIRSYYKDSTLLFCIEYWYNFNRTIRNTIIYHQKHKNGPFDTTNKECLLYDTNGNNIESFKYVGNSSKLSGHIKKEFNQANKLSKVFILHDTTSIFDYYTSFIYDSLNLLKRSIVVGRDSNQTSRTEYNYNNLHDLINESRYGAGDTLIDYIEYEYDNNSNLIRKTHYWNDSKPHFWIIYEYLN
ncbi:MAG: hypothetical protein PHW12_04515 [Smithella sp.]|nr:hypothetical protein [Smithella sp.]